MQAVFMRDAVYIPFAGLIDKRQNITDVIVA
jgi:hypothetical protein